MPIARRKVSIAAAGAAGLQFGDTARDERKRPGRISLGGSLQTLKCLLTDRLRLQSTIHIASQNWKLGLLKPLSSACRAYSLLLWAAAN